MNPIARWGLVVAAVAGLAVDAYTHLDLAHGYDVNRTDVVSQGTLFRVEAVLAIAVAVLLIVRRTVWTALATVAVAGGGLATLLLYRYVDVGKIGPLPPMYEPIWYTEKSWSAAGETIAAGAALGLLVLAMSSQRPRSHVAA